MKREPPSLDAVEVEHVIDHAIESLRLLVDVRGVGLRLLEGNVLVTDHLAEA